MFFIGLIAFVKFRAQNDGNAFQMPFLSGVSTPTDYGFKRQTISGGRVHIAEAAPQWKIPGGVSFTPLGTPYLGSLKMVVDADPLTSASENQTKALERKRGIFNDVAPTQTTCSWRIARLQRFQNGVWQEVALPSKTARGLTEIVDPRGQIAGFNWQPLQTRDFGRWKMTVTVEVQASRMQVARWNGHSTPPTPVFREWKASANRVLDFVVSQNTIEQQRKWLQTKKPDEAYSIKPVALKPDVAYISHLEWKYAPIQDQNGKIINPTSWQKMPQPGDAEYPLTISNISSITLRAVRRDPKSLWPNSPRPFPIWVQADRKDFPSYGEEDTPFFSLPSRTGADYDIPFSQDFVVSATCGNKVSATIRVVSKLESWAPKSIALFLTNSNSSKTTEIVTGGVAKIGVDIRNPDKYGTQGMIYGVRLRATYADGSSAGTFKMARATNAKFLYVSSSNNPYDNEIEYSTAPRTGIVSIVAESIDTTGRPAVKSAPFLVKLVAPTFTVNPSPWQWNGDHWQREWRVESAISKGTMSGNARFRLRIVTPQGYKIDRGASWLDAKDGKTSEYGWANVMQNWKFVPGASLSLDAYQVEAVPLLQSSTR